MSPYLKTLKRLYALNIKKRIGMGLTPLRRMLEEFGDPQNSYPSVLVAGSNGKGSTTSKLAQVLTLAGYRVGLYTSPHISTFRERIQVDGKMIEEKEIVEIMRPLFKLGKELSYFELVTAMAFSYFHKKQVDIAILEVGLGGRLDATNVVNPLLSIITSISLEHTAILGDTREMICHEKAGIARPGVPLIVGPEVPLGPLEFFDYDIHLVEDSPDEDINTRLAAKALQMLEERFPVSAEALEQGLKKLPPCRYEAFEGEFILDVAHNPAALQRLADRLPSPAVWVLSLSEGREIEDCLKAIENKVSYLIVTQGRHPRCLPAQWLKDVWDTLPNHIPCRVTKNIAKAMATAKVHVERPVIVTGTFFMMDEVRKALECDFPSDPYEMNEYHSFRKRRIKRKDAKTLSG